MNFLIHPITIHFPIAFYFLELILLLIWAAKNDSTFLRFASFMFKAAFIGMIIAIAAGLYDVGGFEHIQGRVKTHFIWALSVLGLQTLRAIFWRIGKPEQSHYRATQILFSAAAFILVTITAYFGGLLVYGN